MNNCYGALDYRETINVLTISDYSYATLDLYLTTNEFVYNSERMPL